MGLSKRSRVFSIFLPSFLMIAAAGCSHAPPSTGYGIQEQHAGYVPARIAVLPCQTWPNGARFKSLPLANVKPTEIQELCNRYDDYVIAGFKDQPYMRGFSPKWVQKYLDDAGTPGAIADVGKLWEHRKDDCSDCTSPPDFYRAAIENRTEWRLWLQKFSEAVRNTDAILYPFVTYAYETTYVDRGIKVAKRAVGLTLLLIDTNNGYLLWSGGREAQAAAQRLGNAETEQALAYPLWDEIYERAFVEDLWKEFPGRQFFK